MCPFSQEPASLDSREKALNNAWQPTASLTNLKRRADILRQIRNFFAERDVLEVETPLMGTSSATDPHLASLTVNTGKISHYLLTSPEFPMKRLLAAGSGSIYQICKAFRQEESGSYHNPEFTMLEWYRVRFDLEQLMAETDDLLQAVLGCAPAERTTYQALFLYHFDLNPHTCSLVSLKECAHQQGLGDIENPHPTDRNFWLSLLLSHCIEPHLGQQRPIFVEGFPVEQAALAKIRPGNPPVAERFEVYYKGIELANGYHELQDPAEQRRRFEQDNLERQAKGLPLMPADERLLSALQHGLPDCAGIALGIDRLVMLATGATAIREVMAFEATGS
ncbi:MAG: elongation factor P--(R)-beta-lysine ligase [Gammaproteobacteria bacterium]